MELVISIVALVFGGGIGVTALGYIVRHERKHERIDARLENGAGDFGVNTEEHRELRSDLKDVMARTASIETIVAGIRTDLEWLKRKNGFTGKNAGG